MESDAGESRRTIPPTTNGSHTTTEGASNLAGTAYDLEAGAPGQLSFPAIGTTLPAGLTAVGRLEFIDVLDPVQLAKFGLITNTNQDVNCLSEK